MKEEKKESSGKKNYGHTLLRFLTKESVDHERGKTWFLIGGAFAILGIVYGIWSDSLSFSILCILLVGIYTLNHKREAPEIEVSITDLGIRWGKHFFQYSQIKNFWILWLPGEMEHLHFAIHEGYFWKEITIPIFGQDPAQIRALLSYHIPEGEGKSERFTDFLARKLKL